MAGFKATLILRKPRQGLSRRMAKDSSALFQQPAKPMGLNSLVYCLFFNLLLVKAQKIGSIYNRSTNEQLKPLKPAKRRFPAFLQRSIILARFLTL